MIHTEQETTSASSAPSPDQLKTFVHYRKAVRELSIDLHTLDAYAQALDLTALSAQIKTVLDRLETDKFSVAIVGEFKRGKSTFINALLGADVLPTDVLPCSATLNRVTYGMQRRAVLEFKSGSSNEIPFESLADHVTKLTFESEELAKSIDKATVYFPSPYCQNNVDVIDTPGLNDDDAMTDVTLGVLPEVDAAIMVIRAQSPFSEFERKFLETRLLSSDLGRVIFVVNGIDQLNSPADADRVISAVQRRIESNVLERAKAQFGKDSPEYDNYVRKLGKPKVFGLSAYEALEGKTKNNPDRLERSRFHAFEAELQSFLTQQRGAIMLQVPINRVLTSTGELLASLVARDAALSLRLEQFEQAVAESEAEISELRAKKAQQLAALAKAATELDAQVAALAGHFVVDFKQAVLATVDAAEITSEDISGRAAKQAFDKVLSGAMERASAQVIDTYSSRFRNTVESTLVREAARMQSYDLAVHALMGRIASKFSGIAEGHGGPSKGGETATVFIAASLPVFSGVWGGYRSAGWKGAGVGAATSIGVLAAGATGVALLGVSLPLLPVVAALGVASFFSGRWASDSLFKKSRIENFRGTLREAAAARLDKDTSEASVREHFQDKAAQAIEAFRLTIERETESVLSDAQATLAKLREAHAEGRTRTDAEIQASIKMRKDVTSIGERAIGITRQLALMNQPAAGDEPT